MTDKETIEISATPDTVRMLDRMQHMINEAQMSRDQAVCLVADLTVWVLLCSSADAGQAIDQLSVMVPAITENIAENGPSLIARRKLLEQLKETPQWVN